MRLLHRRATVLLPLLPLLPLFLGACGDPDDAGGGPDGQRLYRIYACAQCHGENGKGSKVDLGPTLKGKREHWDATKLEAYLQDPKGYAAGVERLGQAKTSMPALPPSLSEAERAALVEYALGLMD